MQWAIFVAGAQGVGSLIIIIIIMTMTMTMMMTMIILILIFPQDNPVSVISTGIKGGPVIKILIINKE